MLLNRYLQGKTTFFIKKKLKIYFLIKKSINLSLMSIDML